VRGRHLPGTGSPHPEQERPPDAEKIVLVLDNLIIHTPASLYVSFEQKEAKRLAEKLEIHWTPKHGSWLNAAEIELALLLSQASPCRISCLLAPRHF
jgi:hypothetical protein